MSGHSFRNDGCVFCGVLDGELPAEFVHEDERVVAVMDINPWTRGHLVVFPREHSRNLFDIGDEDLAACALAARGLGRAMRERLGADGVNLLSSAERAAWQTVWHFHLHVIPRYAGDPLELPVKPSPATPEELAAVAAELRG